MKDSFLAWYPCSEGTMATPGSQKNDQRYDCLNYRAPPEPHSKRGSWRAACPTTCLHNFTFFHTEPHHCPGLLWQS
jgi:hypothetical protein